MQNLNRRLRDSSMFLLGAGFVAIVGAAFPSQVSGAAAKLVAPAAASPSPKPITCSYTGTSSCLDVTNSSSGVAVYGTSKSGTGLRGLSTSNDGLKATSTSSYGVYGQSSSGPAGIYGTMQNKVGILGADTGTGIGVEGTAAGGNATVDNGIGVFGVSSGVNGIGVFGRDNASEGTGVFGVSNTGTAVEGSTVSGVAIGGYGGDSGTGLYAGAGSGMAIDAISNSGIGAEVVGSTFGVVAIAATNGLPLLVQDPSHDVLFDVDGQGNVTYRGTLKPSARTRSGYSATAYGAKTTAPTIEDTGTGHLIDGTAMVPLDAVFATTIDATSPYRVLITPDGDSRGLYVATKSPAGFVVRESQGGRSTMDFDYRIVAVAIGHAGDRMALTRGAEVKGPALATPRPHDHMTAPLR